MEYSTIDSMAWRSCVQARGAWISDRGIRLDEGVDMIAVVQCREKNTGRTMLHWKDGVRIGVLGILGALGVVGCGRVATENIGATHAVANESAGTSLPEPAQPTYRVYTEGEEPSTRVHVVRVPAGAGWQVVPWVEAGLVSLPERLQRANADGEGAIAAINGGFFDPANQLTTSYIRQDGEMAADPQANLRLMQNPDLQPYMAAILNRSEFRVYACAVGTQYAIARYQDPAPADCQILHSLGAGPQLVPRLTATEEGFWQEQGGIVVRDAIGRDRPNARSAIGLTASGEVLLVMVAHDSGNPGMTLSELAAFLEGLGAVEALNLDGGGSTGLWFQGEAISGEIDQAGTPVWRAIHSGLVVVPDHP